MSHPSLRKHVKMTDVAAEFLKIFYVREKKAFKVKLRWWNIGKCHAPWCLNIDEKLEIKLPDWKLWEPYIWG